MSTKLNKNKNRSKTVQSPTKEMEKQEQRRTKTITPMGLIAKWLSFISRLYGPFLQSNLWLDFVLQLIYILKRNGDGGDPEIATHKHVELSTQKYFELSTHKLQPKNTSSYQPRNCIIKHSFKLLEIQQPWAN